MCCRFDKEKMLKVIHIAFFDESGGGGVVKLFACGARASEF